MSDDTNTNNPEPDSEQTIDELSDKQLDGVAGGNAKPRVEITREQWEKLASTKDFDK